MKEPLKDWRGPPPETTPNTLYESAGEITVTMSVEMAAFLLGRIGKVPSGLSLPNGQSLDLYQGYYKPVIDALKPYGMESVRMFGGQTVEQFKQLKTDSS